MFFDFRIILSDIKKCKALKNYLAMQCMCLWFTLNISRSNGTVSDCNRSRKIKVKNPKGQAALGSNETLLQETIHTEKFNKTNNTAQDHFITIQRITNHSQRGASGFSCWSVGVHNDY